MKVELLGVSIDAITRDELVETLTSWAGGGGRRRAYYVNAHALNLAYEDAAFRESLCRADLVYCDGFGVKMAARLTRQRLPERMTPPDWIDVFAERLGVQGISVFLLGDEQGVVEKCAEALVTAHPLLSVAGIHHGFFDLHSCEEGQLIEKISRSGADVLLVGMGMPRQELWIEENVDRLDVALALPVGALFRWYSGVEKRAPQWVTERGMEWVARLIAHPLRHFRRYIVGIPVFLFRVLLDR